MFSRLITVAALAAVASGAYINPRPKYTEQATFARWLVHESNWTTAATTSVLYNGTAFANMMSTSDSKSFDTCDGTPFLYFASVSTIFADVAANPRVSLGFFEAGLNDAMCVPGAVHDPEDPLCAKVHIVGDLKLINDTSAVEKYFYFRHPAMKNWPAEHGWSVWGIDIVSIDLLDFYGGLAHISVADYMKASCK